MSYNFINASVDKDNIFLPESENINEFVKKSHYAEIIRAIDFIASDETFLYVHGFLGTGKRQFINYVTEFFSDDVIKLNYYCKPSTVCDDILLSFIDKLEQATNQKNTVINAKITTLSVKFEQMVTAIKRPIVIVLHSYDDILVENLELITSCFSHISENDNVKIIISTRATIQGILGDKKIDRQVFLKAFPKNIFKEFIDDAGVEYTETTFEDFYKYTRGYYFYTALVVRIVEAMHLSLHEFLEKFALTGMDFDAYIGLTYINLVPAAIRNFFWFLRTIRHGLTFNALAAYELYDEFSVEYLKNNLMAFVDDDTIFVQDYFQQDIDISIPAKTEEKLHKYIISLYEKELKEPLQTRSIMISRQALRQEIEYHNGCINRLSQDKTDKPEIQEIESETEAQTESSVTTAEQSLDNMLKNAKELVEHNKNTEAIEVYHKILETENPDEITSMDIKMVLARLYKSVGDYSKSQHYYELVERFYKANNEVINLNYLYYELTDLYFVTYKNDRAIETAKKVIYSVDTPQSLMVDACTLLGNIYSSINNTDEAYKYYQKALESLDENADNLTVTELYFKYALANDDKGDTKTAFEYYTRCISMINDSPYKSLAYSNMGSCYFDNENYSDARNCFEKAYNLDKAANNYDGIYYNSLYLAKILLKEDPKNALNYFIEAKQSAEFLNEDFYILEATIALGDYYYDNVDWNKKALKEYLSAKKIADRLGDSVDMSKINGRIQDMKLRMDESDFEEIEKKYE